MYNNLFAVYIIFLSITSILCVCIKTILSKNSIENTIDNTIDNTIETNSNDYELDIPPRYILQESKSSLPSYNAINV